MCFTGTQILRWPAIKGCCKTSFNGGHCLWYFRTVQFYAAETPPKADDGSKITLSDILGLEALKLLKDRNFFDLFVSSILICIPLAFYYQNANPFLSEIGVKMPQEK